MIFSTLNELCLSAAFFHPIRVKQQAENAFKKKSREKRTKEKKTKKKYTKTKKQKNVWHFSTSNNILHVIG